MNNIKSFSSFISESGQYEVAVNQNDYSGSIKRTFEEAGPFKTKDSLMSYYDIKKEELSEELSIDNVNHIKEELDYSNIANDFLLATFRSKDAIKSIDYKKNIITVILNSDVELSDVLFSLVEKTAKHPAAKKLNLYVESIMVKNNGLRVVLVVDKNINLNGQG